MSPSASGSSSVRAYSDRWSGPSARAASSVAAQRRTDWPGRRTAGRARPSRCPRPARLATAVATSAGRCRRPSAAQLAGSNALRPERDPRDARRAERARRRRARRARGWPRASPRRPSASPKRSRIAVEDRARWPRAGAATACRRRGRRCRAAASAARRERRSSSASARELELGSRAATNAAMRLRGPRAAAPANDDEVAVRAERDAERDVEVQRDRRRGPPARRRRARPPVPASTAVPIPRRRRLRQPSGGRRRRRSTSSTSRPRGSGWPAWPVRQEDREPGDRVAEERRADAAGETVRQPPTSPMPMRARACTVPARRPEARRQRVADRLDDVRERRIEAGRGAGGRTARRGRRPRR